MPLKLWKILEKSWYLKNYLKIISSIIENEFCDNTGVILGLLQITKTCPD